MRIDLKAPFEQKDEAKALGARWDAARKTWYCLDPSDLAPFARWLGVQIQREKHGTGRYLSNKQLAQKRAKAREDTRHGGATERSDFSLPACGCVEMPPWEDCEHTEPLDSESVAHLRAILAGH